MEANVVAIPSRRRDDVRNRANESIHEEHSRCSVEETHSDNPANGDEKEDDDATLGTSLKKEKRETNHAIIGTLFSTSQIAYNFRLVVVAKRATETKPRQIQCR